MTDCGLVGLKAAVGNFNLVLRLLSFDFENIVESRNIGFSGKHGTDYLEIEDCLVYILGVCLKSSSASLVCDSSLVM